MAKYALVDTDVLASFLDSRVWSSFRMAHPEEKLCISVTSLINLYEELEGRGLATEFVNQLNWLMDEERFQVLFIDFDIYQNWLSLAYETREKRRHCAIEHVWIAATFEWMRSRGHDCVLCTDEPQAYQSLVRGQPFLEP